MSLLHLTQQRAPSFLQTGATHTEMLLILHHACIAGLALSLFRKEANVSA